MGLEPRRSAESRMTICGLQTTLTATVDIGDLDADHLRDAQSRGIGSGQRHPALQARNRFKKAHDLIGAQNDRQLAGNALWDRVLPEGHPVEKAQSADDLTVAAW
jgi:hypothetical protein